MAAPLGLTLKSAAIEPTPVPGLVGSAIEFLERAGGGSKRVSDQAMAGSNSTRSNAKCLARLTIEEFSSNNETQPSVKLLKRIICDNWIGYKDK